MKRIVIAFLLCIVGMVSASAQSPAENPKIINGGILNGKAVSLPKPVYPDEARLANVGGAIVVDIIIDEAGNVMSAKRAASAKVGNGEEITEVERLRALLEEASENAALQARFTPTRINSNPVKVRGRIIYNFVAGEDGKTISDDVIRTISGGVLNSKATSLPLPSYPPAAAAVRAEGAVSVNVTVDQNGRVVSAQAASGHPLLQAAAVEAAKKARFAPTLLSGEPVKVSGIIMYNFVAGGPEDK